ncbi:MAG: hypothetical protein PHR22_03155, partial [Candidatus Omnitrophica bacterium]|nr:hypothetical protein [Candidatus Omnitrophota bacterium]
MAGIIKKLSLIPAGLRYKLTVVFVLMSFIPLAICVYLAYNFIYFPFLQPNIDLDFTTKNVSLVIGLTILIALLGFKIIWDIASPIIDMAVKAKGIANGDFSKSIDVKSEDEVGELG